MTAYPFIFHSISMSLFASVIGPFGGFFASGFKRAFKIKVKPVFFVFFLLHKTIGLIIIIIIII